MEIVNYEEQPQGSKVLAFFGVYVKSGITYNHYKLIHGKNGTFIASPSKNKGDMDNPNWVPYIEMSQEKKADFDKVVMDLLKPYMKREE